MTSDMTFERVQDEVDPFDDPAPTRVIVQRDNKDRPRIFPLDGGKRKSYARCTTFVGCLEDQYTVHLWQMRMTAIGLADRPDLLLSVAANRDDRKELNTIVERAREAAKANTGSTTGTALHTLAEHHDLGRIVKVPPGFAPDIEAYKVATAMFEMVSIEQFCVLDQWGGVGGTPDRVIKFNGRYYIGDIKTGTIDFGMLKFAMQFATYGHSVPYDFRAAALLGDTATREEAVKLRKEWPGVIDQQRALLIHLPQGQGRCDIYWVDISLGWDAVRIAAAVRAWRNRKDFLTPFNVASEYAKADIEQATHSDDVRRIYLAYVDAGHDPVLILDACRNRVKELT